MADPRIEQLANTLVNHSIEVKEGERILINASAEAAPLIREVYRKVIQAGGRPTTNITIPGLQKIFVEEAADEQLKDIEVTEAMFKLADGLISIMAPANTKELTNTNPEKLATLQKASQPIMERVMKGGVKWVGTQYPTNAAAQEAEMSLEEYESFVYGATNIDYKKLKETMDDAAAQFNKAKKVRIVSNETDITVDIEGREAAVSFGKHNVPDGEFFFSPNHLKTEGTIYYDWPAVYGGREVNGVRLTFREGKVVEYSAEKGEGVLEQALNTDDGARYLGELGIGTNFGIQKPTKNILFDEKIGGSIHMALGRAYETAGKGNESAIHWDMVKNLRDGGEIYLDGKLVQKDGKWVF